MEHSTSLPELAEAFFAALTLWASGCCVYFLTVHAHLTDFDPRPAVYRAARAAHQGVVYAGHDVNCAFAAGRQAARDARAFAALSLRDAALSVAALLALLLPAHGGTQ